MSLNPKTYEESLERAARYAEKRKAKLAERQHSKPRFGRFRALQTAGDVLPPEGGNGIPDALNASRTKPHRRRRPLRPRRYNTNPTVDGDSLRAVKDECDTLVRSVIALRDEQCVTCPAREELHVGHLFRRGHEHVRYDLRNVSAQCDPCNSRHNEHPEFYIERFVMTHGEQAYADLRAEAHKRGKLSYVEMLAIRDELRQTLVEMTANAASR
jgi:hypothetical protein